MRRFSIGEGVEFISNTGRRTEGQIIRVLVEKKPPNVLLIERTEDRWRVFRLESDVSPRLKADVVEPGRWE
jgi:hypothetical protein